MKSSPPSTLRLSLVTRLRVLIIWWAVGLMLIAGWALWGLNGLTEDASQAVAEYRRVQWAYEVTLHLEKARDRLMRNEDQALGEVVLASRLTQQHDRLAITSEMQVIQDDLQELAQTLASSPMELGYKQQQAIVDTLRPVYGMIQQVEERIEAIEQQKEARRQRVATGLMLLSVVVLVPGMVLTVWQYRAVVRPMRRLTRQVKVMAQGQLDRRLPLKGDRELVQFSQDFNAMADELESLYTHLEERVRLKSTELARAERLASVGYLAAGVAHEINNPLAIIAGEAELAHSQPGIDLTPSLQIIRDEAFRCKKITERLLMLARSDPGQRQVVNLVELVQQTLTLAKSLPQGSQRLWVCDLQEALWVKVDVDQIKQVLLNLLSNALSATDSEQGEIQITAEIEARAVRLKIQDNGHGMDQKTLERIFEPFYTYRPRADQKRGTGLGLSISHAIMMDHDGQLLAVSKGLDQGSCLTMVLPKFEPDGNIGV